MCYLNPSASLVSLAGGYFFVTNLCRIVPIYFTLLVITNIVARMVP